MLTRVVLEVSFPTMDNEFIDLILRIPFRYRANHRIHREFMKNLCPDLCKIPHLKTMLPISTPLCMWQLGNAYQFGKQRIKQAVWQCSRGHLSVPERRTYVSFDEWLRTDQEWQDFLTQLLLSKGSASNRYFNQQYVRHLFSEHQRGRANNGRRILYLATFELLLRQFFVSWETKNETEKGVPMLLFSGAPVVFDDFQLCWFSSLGLLSLFSVLVFLWLK